MAWRQLPPSECPMPSTSWPNPRSAANGDRVGLDGPKQLLPEATPDGRALPRFYKQLLEGLSSKRSRWYDTAGWCTKNPVKAPAVVKQPAAAQRPRYAAGRGGRWAPRAVKSRWSGAVGGAVQDHGTARYSTVQHDAGSLSQGSGMGSLGSARSGDGRPASDDGRSEGFKNQAHSFKMQGEVAWFWMNAAQAHHAPRLGLRQERGAPAPQALREQRHARGVTGREGPRVVGRECVGMRSARNGRLTASWQEARAQRSRSAAGAQSASTASQVHLVCHAGRGVHLLPLVV